MIDVRKDLTGMQCKNVTILKRHSEDYVFPNGRKMAMWWCKCNDCGREFAVIRQDLTSKKVLCECSKSRCTYDLTGEFGIGFTTKGEPFWFDLEDYDRIQNHCWHYDENGYPRTTINGKHIRLHRFIMNVVDSNIVVDHRKHPPRNEHKIDNRKSNLRITNPKGNVANSSLAKNNTSGTTGVYWKSDKNKWEVKFPIDGKLKHIAYFDFKEDAIKARKELEEKYFGEYAYDVSQKE